MNKTSESLLKNKKAKIMVVDQDFAQEIENLSKKMNTSSKDVVISAVELLKLCLSREVIIRKPNSGIEIKLPFFKSIEPEIRVNGEE